VTIAVGLTRTSDGPDVLAALRAGGVSGELSKDGHEVVVSGDDGGAVTHLLEEWALRHELPFVPVRVDGTSYALVPPAG
jgi:hypothetical protein